LQKHTQKALQQPPHKAFSSPLRLVPSRLDVQCDWIGRRSLALEQRLAFLQKCAPRLLGIF
jgi:hypothetical protein